LSQKETSHQQDQSQSQNQCRAHNACSAEKQAEGVLYAVMNKTGWDIKLSDECKRLLEGVDAPSSYEYREEVKHRFNPRLVSAIRRLGRTVVDPTRPTDVLFIQRVTFDASLLPAHMVRDACERKRWINRDTNTLSELLICERDKIVARMLDEGRIQSVDHAQRVLAAARAISIDEDFVADKASSMMLHHHRHPPLHPPLPINLVLLANLVKARSQRKVIAHRTLL